MNYKLISIISLAATLCFSGTTVRSNDQITTRAFIRSSEIYPALLVVTMRVPAGQTVYADEFSLTTEPVLSLHEIVTPESTLVLDAFSGVFKPVYTADFTKVFALHLPTHDGNFRANVTYLACDEFTCFLPQTKSFDLTFPATATAPAPSSLAADLQLKTTMDANDSYTWQSTLQRFDILASHSGYMDAPEFLEFLNTPSPNIDGTSNVDATPKLLSYWWLLLLVLLGGIALNLTPCVLPMIPVNLAVIGAGTRAIATTSAKVSRRRGFLLGGIYGAGITVSYGVLGVIVIMTGAFFGAFNASPVFNFAVAALFIILALAMFDLLAIDFSRWQTRLAVSRTGGGIAVFLMGAVSAVLAGACVAPVVITVLTQALLLNAAGNRLAALLLPFVLGFGMALPWPFAGAGLAALPKPGRWMQLVKYAIGIMIAILALYYARQGWSLLSNRTTTSAAQRSQTAQSDGWLTSLPEALARAEQTGQPVLIDFWATWCKNCTAMDATTLRHPKVIHRLKDFVGLKYQAERPGQEPARTVLAAFNVLGLPTFIILQPKVVSASP